MNDKKSRERAFLDEIRSLYLEFPAGTPIEHERPDFVINLPSLILGIEVVDYVRGQNNNGSSIRQREIVGQRMADTARLKFLALHSEPLVVNFFFHAGKYPSTIEVEELAHRASALIANRTPQNLFEHIRLGHEQLENYGLEKYVSAIQILRVSNERQSLWSFQESGVVDGQINELRNLIASKEARVGDYLQHCDKVWLVIVADGRHISSMVEFDDDVRQHPFSTRFDRILFYDRLTKEIISLASR